MFDVKKIDNNPRYGIIFATMILFLTKNHTTLGASPMQMVFVCGAILNAKHVTNWKHTHNKNKHILTIIKCAKTAAGYPTSML